MGWLNQNESKGYNYICGNVKSTIGHVNYGKKSKITFEVINANSKIKPYLMAGKIAINVKININQNVGMLEGDFDITKQENIKILNKLAEKRVKLLCNSVVTKAQKKLKIDIFGFGNVIHQKYPKVWKNLKNNWNNKFTNIPVTFTVIVKTIQTGQITNSFFKKE